MQFNRIHGLTPNDDDPIRQPRLGKIRNGVKLQKEKVGQGGKKYVVEYPTETEYFVLTDAPGVAEACGTDKPNEIRGCVFVSETLEEIFPQCYAAYGSDERCVCRGNGLIAERRALDSNGKNTGHFEERKCPCEWLEGDRPKCSIEGRLQIMIPEANMGGVYEMMVHGVTVLSRLNQDLRAMIAFCQRMFGRVALIPFTLVKTETRLRNPKTGKMVDHWLPMIRRDHSLEEVQRIRNGTVRLGNAELAFDAAVSTKALPYEPEDEPEADPDTGEIIETQAEPAPVEVEPEDDLDRALAGPDKPPDPNAPLGPADWKTLMDARRAANLDNDQLKVLTAEVMGLEVDQCDRKKMTREQFGRLLAKINYTVPAGDAEDDDTLF